MPEHAVPEDALARGTTPERPASPSGSAELLAEAEAATTRDRQIYDEFAVRPDFIELRRRYRMFAFPATIAFMVWYVTYVICNNWARGFMDTPVIGHINIAVVFGLLQFVSTFAIAFFYARHATRSLDPLAAQLHDDFDVETNRTKLDRETGR